MILSESLEKSYRGGQRQIVWMLRLIFSNKKVALLDEPTSWMSSRVSEAYLNCLRRNKITALIVTHDRNVQSFADVELDWDDVTMGSNKITQNI
jgi:ABC-type lipoprotein export system ATPase subunit